jgi:uncharacterized protein YxjI
VSAEPLPTPAAPVRFHVQQKITPFANRYRVFADSAGEPGPLIAFAKQKRMAFKEQFTLYRDEQAQQPVLTVKADRRIDIRSVMTVTDPTTGEALARLRKLGAKSILRSTWEVEQPGRPVVTVTERSALVAALRRFWGLIPYVGDLPVPWVFHFDGRTPDGELVLAHSRRWGIRDRYVLELPSATVDARVAIALAVLLDAMQHR